METAERQITGLETAIADMRRGVATQMRLEAERTMFSNFNETKVAAFFKQPWVTIAKRPQEWYVIVPSFIDFQIGWLEKSTESYNVFLVNKFMNWLAQVPEELKKQFDFKPGVEAIVTDGIVVTTKDHQDEVWNRYKEHLAQRMKDNRIRIRRGHEFKLIADMINDGVLPFLPQPVDKEDLRAPQFFKAFTPRDYQLQAWKRFKETGAVGIFWPFSAGKTFIGLWAIANLQGPHLVVVPTNTLREQWEERLREYLGWNHGVTIVTYQGYEKVRQKPWKLVVFDEVHRLPANTFSRMATIRADYRIGLSGTPYREDGRTDYIFALTGFPVGLDWHKLLEMGILKKPSITLFVFDEAKGKVRKLAELLRDPVKTIVFCDSIDLGKRLSSQFEIPFVHGETTKRMSILRETQQVIVSRVGDEGVSLPDIRRVIEIDFLFGSRRQEAQRMGRLFHGTAPGEHIILMTESELAQHEKRLYAIYEKGWNVKVVR